MDKLQMITALYAAICGLLLVFMAVRVSYTRGKEKVDLGDGGKDAMLRAMRTHGNAAEYIPISLILLFFLEMQGSAHWFLHLCGIALVVSRLLHMQGLMQSAKLTPGRLMGTGLGWALITVMSLDNLFHIL
ncbi:MAG TPA: MAPEG family protein [Gammaproteobacteria bacterium]|jgi:hypothetical protein